jgi:hypothetical protein
LFEPRGEHFVATELSTSPWSEETLHGGPVAALFAQRFEQWPTDAAMLPARLTVELLQPFGFDPFGIDVRAYRPGRKVQVLEAVMFLASDGPTTTRPIARATLQQIRSAPVPVASVAAGANGEDPGPPPPESLPRSSGSLHDDTVRFHNTGVEHRVAGHFLTDPGPAVDWIRVVVDLLPGEPPSPLARVAAAADFGNGVSSVLSFTEHLFVNPDLTIHLTRLPVDEWVCLDAVTRLGDDGVGLAESALFDRNGRIGRSVQSLLVEKL